MAISRNLAPRISCPLNRFILFFQAEVSILGVVVLWRLQGHSQMRGVAFHLFAEVSCSIISGSSTLLFGLMVDRVNWLRKWYPCGNLVSHTGKSHALNGRSESTPSLPTLFQAFSHPFYNTLTFFFLLSNAIAH